MPQTAARQRPIAELEAEFQAAVIQYAEINGWRWWHDTDSRRSKPGLLDLLLWRGPRHIVAELKVGSRTTTFEQCDYLAAAEAAGAEAVVWRPTPAPATERWHRIETSIPVEQPLRMPFPGGDFGAIGIRLVRPLVDPIGYDARCAARHLDPNVRAAITRE